jgi:phosphoglycolate phosphatase-like HAD superfamily hydrolase
MTTSDIIAIIAVVATALVSIISHVANYLINRANNTAKLREIVFQKRIEAYRELYRAVDQLMSHMLRVTASFSDRTMDYEFEESRRRVVESVSVFTEVYSKNKIYVTGNISNVIDKFIQNIFEHLVKFDFIVKTGEPAKQPIEDYLQFCNTMSADAKRVLREIQKSISG